MPLKLFLRCVALLVFSATVLGPLGCKQPAAPASRFQQKSFPVRGKVVSVTAGTVMLDHEAVPGFMDAMTMSYKLKDPSVGSELHPGDRITATILVKQDDAGYSDPELDNIVVIAQARPDYKPAVQYHVPQPGDSVPDFKLLNQSDRTIHLRQFRGKILLITFVYTRCTLADYCPRMSRNFAQIDAALAKEPALYRQTHLLSISFDPTYDTPKVLRSYGGAYTGNFTRENFAHWDFAAPPVAELPAITQFFNVGITPGENRSLTHSLSTLIVDQDGKVANWYPTNDWQPADLVARVHQLAHAS